jgi:hypothetical protein
VLDIFLDDWVVEFSSDESFGVEDGVEGIFGGLIVCGIADQSFVISESDVGWGCSVTLIIGDDFDSFVFPESDTGVSGTEIDTDGFTDSFFLSHEVEI